MLKACTLAPVVLPTCHKYRLATILSLVGILVIKRNMKIIIKTMVMILVVMIRVLVGIVL